MVSGCDEGLARSWTPLYVLCDFCAACCSAFYGDMLDPGLSLTWSPGLLAVRHVGGLVCRLVCLEAAVEDCRVRTGLALQHDAAKLQIGTFLLRGRG
jgi:hypothetical protein